MRRILAVLIAAAGLGLCAGECTWDVSVGDFPACADETDDTARFQRAIDATGFGRVLYVPRGVYRLSSPLIVHNMSSLLMHKSAVLRAEKEMPFVLKVNNAPERHRQLGDAVRLDYGMFVTGGCIDGNGLASCMALDGFEHYTLRDTSFMNGKLYGLRVNGEAGGYELIAFNLYFKCIKPGMAGNAAVYSTGGDSHYTDCVAVDYTVGFRMGRGGSNRLTRCHVWGGPLPPVKEGEPREMLKDSVNFWIDGAGSTILRDCYADTGKIGFLIDGFDTRVLGCSYFNNKHFKLDGITVFKHPRGRLLVTDCGVVKTMPNYKVYDGCGLVQWQNMMYSGFGPKDDCPGALTFNKKSATDQPALKLAD